MQDICSIHGCELKPKFWNEGTPYASFDGLCCPKCEEMERIQRNIRDTMREFERADYQAFLTSISEADRLKEDRRRADNRLIERITARLIRDEHMRFMDLVLWDKRLSQAYANTIERGLTHYTN